MPGYNTPSMIELENSVLRERYAALLKASKKMIATIDRYVEQGCLRSELLNTKNELQSLTK